MIKRNFSIRVAVICFMFSLVQIVSQAESLSTKELLKYTLDSVRSKMNSAVQENQGLSIKNTSIRKRILFLKKEMRGQGDKMIILKEQAVNVKNSIKLSAAEVKLDDKRLTNVLERNRYLTFERDTLKTQLETMRLERDMMEDEVEEMSFDIKELEGSLGLPAASNLLDYYEEEKLRFIGMVQDYRRKIGGQQDKVDALDLKIAGQLRTKERALRERESLRRMMSDWGLRMKEEEARSDLLNRGMQRRQEVLKNKRKSFEVDNKNQREYSKELIKTAEDIKVVRQDLDAQFERDVNDMRRYSGLLKEENEWLYKYQKAIENNLVLIKKKEAQEHRTLLLTDAQRELENDGEEMKRAVVHLQDMMTKHQLENKSLERDRGRLQKDLDALAFQVEEVKQSVAVVREDVFGVKRKELEGAKEEQQVRINKSEGEIIRLNAEIADFKGQLVLVRNQTGQLEQKVAERGKSIELLSVQEKDLIEQQQEFSALIQENIEAFKDGILNAQMRKRALAASVDVVHQKYQVGADNLKDFNDEKAELSRYLNILGKENMSLQRRLSGLESNE